MSRTERLFQLMTVLRSAEPPVTADVLGQELDISIRTVYRDIDALRGLGAVIDGEAGFGYTLVEDASLPPLAFEDDELEALVLGLREVSVIADPALAKAARSALAKITSRVPQRQAHRLEHAVLDARRYVRPPPPGIDAATLRAATWAEQAVAFSYLDAKGDKTRRTVWPLGIVYLEASNVLLAWCLLRQDYRSFRLDRMSDLSVLEDSFRPRRVSMLREHIARLRQTASDHVST
ncbi:YafY family transcriptional regulator [Aliishimia ponticola]|uniref:YafY family transcriptional regulator n=1 Tax=Aliishimia ponticola TaxID=2499833 RepID=A0A4S4N817_9RHOB|nr:YafY family protein [Aliishimia ponticola]THH35334.1 YafY family transcriptional regulator [Aliishimia ponticola]